MAGLQRNGGNNIAWFWVRLCWVAERWWCSTSPHSHPWWKQHRRFRSGKGEKKREHLSGHILTATQWLTTLARCVTFTSWMNAAVQWKKKIQQESHATLKSKLQIRLKMNMDECKKWKKGQVRLHFNGAHHKRLSVFWLGRRAELLGFCSSWRAQPWPKAALWELGSAGGCQSLCWTESKACWASTPQRYTEPPSEGTKEQNPLGMESEMSGALTDPQHR